MENIKSFQDSLHKISESNFVNHALDLCRYQVKHNNIYRSYVDYLEIDLSEIKKLRQIPFLPIGFFKYHAVKTTEWQPETVFNSSGTTGSVRSRHLIKDLDFYLHNATNIFERSFGSLADKKIIALLPSYSQRQGSSLVSMVNHFIKQTGSSNSGFYLDDIDALIACLMQYKRPRKTFLFGVTFALLDLAENHQLDLNQVTVIETGGMKGRGKEITKEELYTLLAEKLNINSIYSEYGMTELLSQAYGKNGKFVGPPSMQVIIRDINDPFTIVENGKTGGINIIDLANVHSCAFIETKDLGKINKDSSFEVLGRFDNSDLRGCNLLV